MDIEQLAGTKLGNYEIESLLGRGGMGVVYKARQLSLDRPVALKILPPTLSSDPSYIKRFQREAQAVAKLSHPNIAQIHDIAEENHLHFFSMEYIEGQSLDDLLKEKGRLEVAEATEIIVQAAQGIEHAHETNILHRDIKPSNIMLDRRGNVKVMDFGLARMTSEGSKLTQSGTLMGTLDYMSPEQCRGEELDGRTDIYSLGVVLYEMLTGKAPFDAPNEAALIHRIISGEPAEAQSVNPGISPDLSAIVSCAMAKDRDERYASISKFLNDVRTLEHSTPSTAEEKSTPSIAVLPFVNMSADPEQEYFCDGLAEELINALTQINDLHVVARTSAFSFKGEKADIQKIGRKLKVGTILEGSVRKAGNRLRITAQLVKVDDGYHLWSERFDREMHDVFAIQDEITQAIVDKLKINLFGEEKSRLAKRKTVDLEVYNLYLRGRYFWARQTKEGFEKAIENFEQAIELNPGYAHAYAGLADSLYYQSFFGFSTPKEALTRAIEAAGRALEIDNTLAEAHVSMASATMQYEWDWDNAENALKRAIELNPGYAEAHHIYGHELIFLGRFEEGIREMGLASALDPLSISMSRCLGIAYFDARQYEKAIEILTKTAELDPNFGLVNLFLGYSYLEQGKGEEALAAFKKEEKISGGRNPLADVHVAGRYALMGKPDKSRQALNELLNRSKREYVPACWLAVLYFNLGEEEKGLEWLKRAYKEHDVHLCYLKVDHSYDKVRSDPRFIELLKKIGLDK